jgi:hypothetical protein
MSRTLLWYLRRHPLLYKIRFRLISKNVTSDRADSFCYNGLNKKKDIPAIYFQLNNMILAKKKAQLSDIEKVKKIAKWLRNNIKGGPGLGKSSENSLRRMIKGEGGVCSDFAQVFNNFCVINDLKVKEWGLKINTGKPSLLGGHSFNEVYCKEFQKWVIIDVSKSIFFYHISPKLPLSVFELINLKKENKEIYYSKFNKNFTIDNQNINDLYFISNSSPFVITNYRNKTYDYYLDKLGFLPESIIHGLVYLTGNSYAYEFPKYN